MAKTRNNQTTDIIPAEIIDYETGEVMNTAEMEKRLFFLEQQIAFSATQIALSLKEIRDGKYYLCRNFKSMQEYVEKSLPWGISTVKNYRQVADTLNEKTLQKLSNAPMRILIEIARNEELKEEANSEDTDTDDIVKKARELERKKYQKKIDEYEGIIDGKETLLENSRETVKRQNEEIDKLKNAVSEMAASKGIDPDRLVYVTQKKEAIALIQEVLTTNLRLLSDITNISHELVDDPEVSGMLMNAISAMKVGINRIEDTFFMQLKAANNSIDIIPE
jgi:hypothetical protein